MKNIADIVELCKANIEYHQKKASWRGAKPESIAAHNMFVAKYKASIDLLLAIPSERPESKLGESEALFRIDPFDLSGLPDELISELSISKADQEDAQVIQLLRIAKRALNINEVMIGLYRKFDVQYKRVPLSARLYRLAARGDLVNTDKGFYCVPEFSGATPKDKKESPLIAG